MHVRQDFLSVSQCVMGFLLLLAWGADGQGATE